MKNALAILTLCIFSSFVMHAQSDKSSLPKTAEQKEIKATNHLKKKMEIKQLTARPEQIADSAALVKTTEIKKNKRSKSSIKKTDL